MQKRSVQRGRPAGTRTYESEPARAFGVAVREARTAQGLAQEVLAGQAGIARSHMGKIERGERNVTLLNVLRIATAMNCRPSEILAEAGL